MVLKSVGTQTDKKAGKKSAEKGHVNLPTDPNEHNAVSEVEEQSAKTGPVYSCGFEVFGIVQGVSFRMYTLRRAQKLSVRGWCMNTSQNTVKGEIEGYLHSFESMRLWLKHTGSPTSRIDKCVFTDITEHTSFKFSNFSILLE